MSVKIANKGEQSRNVWETLERYDQASVATQHECMAKLNIMAVINVMRGIQENIMKMTLSIETSVALRGERPCA